MISVVDIVSIREFEVQNIIVEQMREESDRPFSYMCKGCWKSSALKLCLWFHPAAMGMMYVSICRI